MPGKGTNPPPKPKRKKTKGGKGSQTYLIPGQLPESWVSLIRQARVGE